MALVAGHAAGMLGGDHLGKVSWLGGVLFMATPAEVGDVGQLRNVGRGIVGVLRQGSMAGLAGDMGMFARGACFGFVVMAEYAGVLPGVGDGVLANQRKRARAVVAVLAKSFGDNRAAYHQKHRQAG